MAHITISKLTVAAGLAVLQLAVSGSVCAQDDERERGKPKKSCTSHQVKTVYRGFGYDHVVTIENRCDHVEHCTIDASSVSGTEEVDVPAQSKREVTVLRGSPAREFTAKVSCKKK